MLKIILNGAGGRMGGAVREQVAGSADDTVLVAEIDKLSEDFSMHSIAEYKGEADVIIDFSHHSAVRELISYALGRSIPLVLSTTGHTEEEKALIYEAAKSVPISYSANMSLGIAILTDFARRNCGNPSQSKAGCSQRHRKQDCRRVKNGTSQCHLCVRPPRNGKAGTGRDRNSRPAHGERNRDPSGDPLYRLSDHPSGTQGRVQSRLRRGRHLRRKVPRGKTRRAL